MSARYVAVRAQHVSEIATLGGICSMPCGRRGSVYAIGRGDTPEAALDAAEDETAHVYDLDTGLEVEW